MEGQAGSNGSVRGRRWKLALGPIKEMIRAGIWFNLVGLVLVIGLFWLLGSTVLGIDPMSRPAWATP